MVDHIHICISISLKCSVSNIGDSKWKGAASIARPVRVNIAVSD